MAITSPTTTQAPEASTANVPAPNGWRDVRNDPDIQFEEFAMAPPEVREPGWFDAILGGIAEFLSWILGPIGQFLGLNWNIIQWVLLGLLAAFVLYWIARSVGPLARSGAGDSAKTAAGSDPEWQPSQEESAALLEDADRLAAEGRFDEATHLLLKRSVTQIAATRPDWVEPSSTARELAALPALSTPARSAFKTISERVERSLFALRTLDRNDWEAARGAYADFARQSIESNREASA
ncbi:MAG: hypothetical protein ABJK59_10895 [Erythrobacter sp.]|uniref:hypothetical protein n=1 Tax=Erythrobacter sp. TaxID=1042 RepID=UPI003299CA6D